MFGIGFSEILLILAVALIAVGPKKLPGLAKTLGKSASEFKGALDEIQSSVLKEVKKPLEEAKKNYVKNMTEVKESIVKDVGAPIDEMKSEYIENLLAERAKEARERKAGVPPETDSALAPPEAGAPGSPEAATAAAPDFSAYEEAAADNMPAPDSSLTKAEEVKPEEPKANG